jgi:small GTP-binding protein
MAMMLHHGCQRHRCLFASGLSRSAFQIFRKGRQGSKASRKLRLRDPVLSRFFSAAAQVTTETTGVSPIVGGLFQLLNDEERNMLQEQKIIMQKARALALSVGISTRDFDSSSSILNDYSTFSVVVAGEYNAGKSTLINAIIGKKLLESGSLPTTDAVTIISASPQLFEIPDIVHHQVHSQPLLQDLTLVDTPGTNAVLTDHTVRTTRLLPAADLILFTTSADRPFSESERQLLESIAMYRKSIVIVINKMDIFELAGGVHGVVEKQRVVDFVTEHASELLGARPIVLAVSARDALLAKTSASSSAEYDASALWKRSNFGALEGFLLKSLTTEAKIKSKLMTPLGGAQGLLNMSLERLEGQRIDLESDVATLNLLTSQFQAWRKELASDMIRIRNDIKQRIQYEGQRVGLMAKRQSVFDFYRICLINGQSALLKEWTKTASATAHETNGAIQTDLLLFSQEAAESIATIGRAQGQAVVEFLGQRPSSKNQSLVGTVTAASRFEETRYSLLNHISRAIQTHVENDTAVGHEQEAMLTNLRRTAVVSAGLILVVLGSTVVTALDLTNAVSGALSGSMALASGAAVVAIGRVHIAQAYATKWDARARDLDGDLDSIFAKELDRVDRRVREGVSPYTRFIEAEQERVDGLTEAAREAVATVQRLRYRINNQR